MAHRDMSLPLSRRDAIARIGAGLGTLGLATVLSDDRLLAAASSAGPLELGRPHFAPKAKRLIQLFMPGGPSQVDTFDYKPDIVRYAGQRPAEVDRKSLRNTRNGLFPSPYGFRQYGQCGKWVSDIFPNVAECVDEICFIHSMHTDIPEHAGAILMMNAGHLQPSRPSLGSWLMYNRLHAERQQHDAALEARIAAMEMAFRMQLSVPEVFDTAGESKSTLEMYGESEYAKGCLLARRLIERGVRVVQLSLSIDGYDIAWDTGHNEIEKGHARLAMACDQGIAALLKDLKQRGLLDETLVVWGGEFGRAPTSEGQKGRDHDHYGYTTWLAGGGVKGGMSYGTTDQFGLAAVENRVHVHDLHATILHLMGLDHERLTYRYSGRDYRLTDVAGHVVREIIA
jgi:hypothetical protein